PDRQGPGAQPIMRWRRHLPMSARLVRLRGPRFSRPPDSAALAPLRGRKYTTYGARRKLAGGPCYRILYRIPTDVIAPRFSRLSAGAAGRGLGAPGRARVLRGDGAHRRSARAASRAEPAADARRATAI